MLEPNCLWERKTQNLAHDCGSNQVHVAQIELVRTLPVSNQVERFISPRGLLSLEIQPRVTQLAVCYSGVQIKYTHLFSTGSSEWKLLSYGKLSNLCHNKKQASRQSYTVKGA